MHAGAEEEVSYEGHLHNTHKALFRETFRETLEWYVKIQTTTETQDIKLLHARRFKVVERILNLCDSMYRYI